MKYYSSEALADPMPKCTIYQNLKRTSDARPDQPALNYYGAKITHRQLQESIEQTAQAFAACGVKAGDFVSFLTVGLPESVAAVYALNKLGATVNTIDPRMDPESIRRMIAGSGSKILVTIDIAFPKVRKIQEAIAQDLIITMSSARSLPPFKSLFMKLTTKTDVPYSQNVITWDDFLARGANATAPEAPYEGDHVVSISYTGGTTNFPKGVMLTNDSLNAIAFNFLHAGIPAHPGDRFLGIIPIFTAYGMVCGLHMPLCYGFELIPIPKFEPAKFGKLVKQFRPNHMISTPAFYETLMESKEMEFMDLSFLVTIGSGGDTMNEGLEHKLHQFMRSHNMRYPLAQGYGLSEVSAAASFCVDKIYKPSSAGIPSITTTISIFDPETGVELGYNQIGEVCITGPSLMKGYFNRPEETAAAMRTHDDGQAWVHSGDLGSMDEDGFLFIKGRVKRMITRFDGHKVFPVNIEGIMADHECVRNVSVIGVNDLRHANGQYPLVLVELAEGMDAQETCKRLYAECQERFEERGRPVAVLPAEKIPLTGSGKNDFRALELEYADFDYLAWQGKL